MNAMTTTAHRAGFLQRTKERFSSALRWLGQPVTLYDDGSQKFWELWFGNASHTGETITQEKALGLSAVWACVNLISNSIGMTPLKLYKESDDDEAKPARRHRLFRILHRRPNADMTAAQFWKLIVVSMLFQGFGAGWIRRTDAGDVVSIEFLLPERLTRTRQNDGSIKSEYSFPNGTKKTIPERDLFWCPYFTLDGITGITPIQYARNVFGIAIAAERAAGKTFKNGLMASIFFTMQRILKPEQRAEFRENMEKVTGAINAGKSPILEGGMDAKAIGINPNDAQLLESRSFSTEEICRWYQVPPHMIGHVEKQTSFGTGVEQQQLGFLVFCLQPIFTNIEQAVDRCCLNPGNEFDTYFAMFTVENFLRGDMKSRAAFYSTMTQNGIMTRDECRSKENLPKLGGNAKVLTVQSNMLPLDKLGEAQAAPVSAIDALKAALGITNDEAES